MDYTILLAHYLRYLLTAPNLTINRFDDKGHTITTYYRYNEEESEKSIDVTPYDLLTFIYTKSLQ